MHYQAVYLLIFSAVAFSSTELPLESPVTSLKEMEKVARVLANLTAAQNKVYLQNRDIEARQIAQNKALEEEQHLLKETFAFVVRKMKSLSKKGGNENTDQQPTHIHPKDCADLYLDGEFESGTFKVWPTWFKNGTGFPVYCDMKTDGGGWTVLHRWGNYTFPKDYFRRTWAEYKNGFGDLELAFWLGNDMITALTSQGAYELRFDVEGNTRKAHSVYRSFWTESDSQHYKLHVEGYDDTASSRESASTTRLGDIFGSHNNAPFSSFDSFRQQQGYGECTQNQVKRPGWWYSQSCPLNKIFYMTYDASILENQYLKREMKIRPALFQKMKESSYM